MDSADIAHGILTGDKQAERRLFDQFRPGVVLMLRRRLNDRSLVEDIANDSLSEALDTLRSRALDDPHRLAAFIHGIAVNLARNANRKEARRRTDADTETVEATADASRDPALIAMRASLARVVREMLATLPVERDREILSRFYLNDEDKDVICRDLGLSTDHFDRVVHRARQRMRAHIEQIEPRLHRHDFQVGV